MEIQHTPKVTEFIRNLDSPLEGRVQRMLDLLESNGPDLRMPYSRSIREGLFELRVLGAVHVRILYFFHAQTIVTVHAFIKKRGALSSRDITRAISVKKEIIASS